MKNIRKSTIEPMRRMSNKYVKKMTSILFRKRKNRKKEP